MPSGRQILSLQNDTWAPAKTSDILEQLHQDIDTWYHHETLRNDRGDTKNDDSWYTCSPDFIANIKSSGTMRDAQKTMTISATSFRGCNRFSPLLTWHYIHDPPDPPVPTVVLVRFKVGWILMVSNHPRGSSWGEVFGKRSWNPTGRVDSYKTMICSISEHLGTCSSLNLRGRRASHWVLKWSWMTTWGPNITRVVPSGEWMAWYRWTISWRWGMREDSTWELYLKKKMACRNRSGDIYYI